MNGNSKTYLHILPVRAYLLCLQIEVSSSNNDRTLRFELNNGSYNSVDLKISKYGMRSALQ